MKTDNKMREIKFRVWNTKTNKMITNVKEMGVFVLKSIYSIDEFLVIPTVEKYPLMQYTGLKDKNGVEIYEGDIVKDLRSFFKDARSYSKVFYQEDRGRFVFGGWEIPAGMSHTFEVIGNIYENQELLKED